MDTTQALELAKDIYALKVVLTPSWDLQSQAHEALAAAMHFGLAVEAEKTSSAPPEPASAPPAAPPAPGTPPQP